MCQFSRCLRVSRPVSRTRGRERETVSKQEAPGVLYIRYLYEVTGRCLLYYPHDCYGSKSPPAVGLVLLKGTGRRSPHANDSSAVLRYVVVFFLFNIFKELVTF
ncbi:hypothetical protein GDO81_027667 [Engystomops pustulosus]|uniref:Uncharacterized protein n=1 Tax=Engystomops pustulosus TaxID=76066 RepID=A0AAV6YLJ8_ENGPU|nr:hypothetical protein GDO81_027667 [Engystomops pustulosus]